MSTNGLISFENSFDGFAVQNFSRTFTAFQHSIVAPGWIDLNPGKSGSVFSRISTNSTSPDLTGAARLIADSNSNLTSFQPKLVVIVTWDRVALHRTSSVNVREP